MEKEIVICAAVQLEDGRVIRGHRHDDCIQTALKWEKAGQVIGRLRQEQQGFVTSRNRFVSRVEATELQRAAGIPSDRTGGLPSEGRPLFSEDLY